MKNQLDAMRNDDFMKATLSITRNIKQVRGSLSFDEQAVIHMSKHSSAFGF